jgi:proteasome lid subunit RPN8/RPN11
MLLLPDTLRTQIERLACAAWPREACGLLLGRRNDGAAQVGLAFPVRNLANANDRYEIDPVEYLVAEERAQSLGLEVVGVWHSHPDQPARPSASDRIRAWEGWWYLILSVTRAGVVDVRSWRLQGGGFGEEAVSARGATGWR